MLLRCVPLCTVALITELLDDVAPQNNKHLPLPIPKKENAINPKQNAMFLLGKKILLQF